ncbi:MAG TPA: hypothetical protein VGZ00_03140 [Candidatus Baltobacteraceae bacterium]|nr:hypothetical protein [Candidatus Baltobacteraceae bacterium]
MEYERYLSPFSWRYGRVELRELFSELERRRCWVTLAGSQVRSGLVSPAELAESRRPSRSNGKSGTITWPISEFSPRKRASEGAQIHP